jgi:hypothetical protein
MRNLRCFFFFLIDLGKRLYRGFLFLLEGEVDNYK